MVADEWQSTWTVVGGPGRRGRWNEGDDDGDRDQMLANNTHTKQQQQQHGMVVCGVWLSGHTPIVHSSRTRALKLLCELRGKVRGHAVSEGQKPSKQPASTTNNNNSKTIGSIKMKNKKKEWE